ncbi:hypothetical protein PIB30_027363 [Stylosanthes scabra]|uniref:Uncharacterized protein n=1 Tax=Stylosanthes scabra TaxID=79078 RepID=A0ABU6SAN9_9FABA|nr:hypothetical protein [Stylosanthes scabra]
MIDLSAITLKNTSPDVRDLPPPPLPCRRRRRRIRALSALLFPSWLCLCSVLRYSALSLSTFAGLTSPNRASAVARTPGSSSSARRLHHRRLRRIASASLHCPLFR